MKIIILFAGISHVRELVTSSLQIAGEQNSAIAGIFLKKKNQPRPYSQQTYSRQASDQEDLPMISETIRWAEEICSRSGTTFKAVYGRELSVSQLAAQTPYADLVVADAKTDFNEYLLTSMNASLKDMLVDAHCPVVLVRSNLVPVQKIVFTYDGSYSSMYAIKMFHYLFPHSTNIPAVLVSADSQRDDQKTNELLLEDWLSHHYHSVDRMPKQNSVKDQLLELTNRPDENVYVVISAYGKEAYPRIFHPSHVQLLLNYSKASLFIAHE